MNRIRGALRLAFCIAVCLLVGSTAVGGGEIAICHALRSGNQVSLSKRCFYLPHYLVDVELVVVGRFHRADGATQGPGLFDVDVEQVLLGRSGEKRLRVAADADPIGARCIVGLRATSPGEVAPFRVRYYWDAENLDARKAVIQAAFDEVVLSADVIYAGRPEPSTDKAFRKAYGKRYPDIGAGDFEVLRKIDVDRVVSGEAIPPGTDVLVNLGNSKGKPRTEGPHNAWLFMSRRNPSPYPRVPMLSQQAGIYPVELEDDVRAALARREKYPLRDVIDEDGLPCQLREIIFLGSVDEAISLLASDDGYVETFGARRLVTLGSEAIGPVARRIEEKLIQAELDGGELRTQEGLIRVLAILAATHEEAWIAYFGLLDKLLTAVSSGIKPPVWRVEFAASQFQKIQAPPTANHSLAWLVESAAASMDWHKEFHNRFVRPGDAAHGRANPLDGELQIRFAERLCRLRDDADGVWRQELQLALDLARIEDRRELAEVVTSTAMLGRVASEPFTDYSGSNALGWSCDGKLLATHGADRLRIWDTADRSVVRSWPLKGDIEALVFAHDGKTLFIAGSEEVPAGGGDGLGREVLRQVDVQTGETLRNFAGEQRGCWSTIELSAAQDVMVSSWAGDLAVWQLPEGKLLRTVYVRQGGHAVLSPDGKAVWRSLGYRGALIEDLLGKRKPGVRCESVDAQFTPDGRLFTLEYFDPIPGKSRGTPKWVERRTEGDFAVMSEAESKAGSKAGKFCIARMDEDVAQVVSLPGEHEVIGIKPAHWHYGSISLLSLSPDDKTLAMGCYHEPVRFYRVPSGGRLRLAGPTHVGDLMDLWFSPDGEVLYSTGDDELTVDWDAETLRPLAVRPTKPRYAREVALEPPRRDLNDPFPLGDGANLNFLYPINGDSFVLPVSVTDAASGETTRQRGIPLPWFMKSHEQGVVPGGKYFYLETQIYDLETLELVAGRRLPGWDIYSVAFSADGSRYAIGAADGRREDATRSLRVLETLSSKTLWYAEWKSGGIQHVVFSPDGKKLAWFDLTSIQVQQLP